MHCQYPFLGVDCGLLVPEGVVGHHPGVSHTATGKGGARSIVIQGGTVCCEHDTPRVISVFKRR